MCSSDLPNWEINLTSMVWSILRVFELTRALGAGLISVPLSSSSCHVCVEGAFFAPCVSEKVPAAKVNMTDPAANFPVNLYRNVSASDCSTEVSVAVPTPEPPSVNSAASSRIDDESMVLPLAGLKRISNQPRLLIACSEDSLP